MWAERASPNVLDHSSSFSTLFRCSGITAMTLLIIRKEGRHDLHMQTATVNVGRQIEVTHGRLEEVENLDAVIRIILGLDK